MHQPPDHGATRRSLAAAPPAPLVGIDDPAGEYRPLRLEVLADDLQPELIKAGERGQVGAPEGTVEHVEVFQMVSVRTSIFGRPRPSSADRRAAPDHPASTPSTVMSRHRLLSNAWVMCGMKHAAPFGIKIDPCPSP